MTNGVRQHWYLTVRRIVQNQLRNKINLVPVLLMAFVASALVGLGSALGIWFTSLVGGVVLGLLPGVLVLRLIGVRDLPLSVFGIYVVGTSLVFVAGVGMVASVFFPIVGISNPLSSMIVAPLLVAVLASAWLPVRGKEVHPLVDLPEISPQVIMRGIILATPLVLAAIGVAFAPLSAVHIPVLILLFSVVVVLLAVALNWVNERLYPLVVFLVALAVLYHTSLISAYVWGWDIQLTYHSADLLREANRWNPANQSSRNPLGILLVVPVIMTNVTGVPLDWVFKLFLPIVIALIPVGTYWIGREFLLPTHALLAALLVPCTFVFFNQIPAKQQLGEFYIVALALVFLSQNRSRPRSILFLIFVSGLTLSHYGSSIVFFLVLVVCTGYLYANRFLLDDFQPRVSLTELILFSVILVGWYMYIAQQSVFYNLVMVPYLAGIQLLSIIGSASGSTTAATQSRTGLYYLTLNITSLVQNTYRLLHVAVFGFLAVGGVAELPRVLSGRQEGGRAFVFGCVGGFVSLLVVGIFARSHLGIDRLYEWGIVVFAPVVVVGWFTIADVVSDVSTRLWSKGLPNGPSAKTLLACFLIVFLIFNTGIVHSATNTTGRPFPLQYPNQDYPVFEGGEVAGGEWSGTYVRDRALYADAFGHLLLLRSFGRTDQVQVLRGRQALPDDTCLVYRRANVRGEVVIPQQESRVSVPLSKGWPQAESQLFNHVYDSGAATVRCQP